MTSKLDLNQLVQNVRDPIAGMLAMNKDVCDTIESIGLLLLQDKGLLSVVGIITGEAVSGSWWGHSKGKEIYSEVQALGDNRDILICKLVEGKVTFVHRNMWDALFAMACSNEGWQTPILDAEERLLTTIRKKGAIDLESTSPTPGVTVVALRKAADQLERKLLIHSEQIHTEAGYHSRILHTWKVAFAKRGYVPDEIVVSKARDSIETAVRKLGRGETRHVKLPWGKVALQ